MASNKWPNRKSGKMEPISFMKHIPNIITLIRVILAPIIAIMIAVMAAQEAIFILCLYIVAAVSDWLDGYLAREMKVISSMGRMLDPIADKLLIAGCLLGLAADRGTDMIFIIPALAILFREILVSGLREYLADTKITVPVTRLAKWKTAVQMTAIGCLISFPSSIIPNWVEIAGLAILWLAGILTIITGWQYFHAARDYL